VAKRTVFQHEAQVRASVPPLDSDMTTSYNLWLIVAAALSGLAALLHVAIVFGGGPWYRFFGAGERMALAFTP